MDSVGHFSHEADTTGDGEDHQHAPGAPATGSRSGGRARAFSHQMGPENRARALSAAINRLEQEHVALLMALCELEESSDDGQDAQVRGALQALLRDDLRRTQHALRLAAHGAYGICEVCHQPLSRRHLALAPAMSRCWACTGRTPHQH